MASGFAILRLAHKTKAKEGQSNSSNTGEDSQLAPPRTAFRITGVSPSEYTSADAELPLKSQPSRDKAPLLKIIAFPARGGSHARKQDCVKILSLEGFDETALSARTERFTALWSRRPETLCGRRGATI